MQFYNHRNEERWCYDHGEMLWFLPRGEFAQKAL